MRVTDSQSLSAIVAKAISKEATSVSLFRKSKGGSAVSVYTSDIEDRKAIEIASEVWEESLSDAEAVGGKLQYQAHCISEDGATVMMATWSIQSESDPRDSEARVAGELVLKYDRAMGNLLTRYEAFLDRTLKHEQELHSKVLSQLEATEKAISMTHQREIDLLREKSSAERLDSLIKSVMSMAVPLAAKKAGIPDEQIAIMLSAVGGADESAKATQKLTELIGVFADMSDEDRLKVLSAMPESARDKLASAMSGINLGLP